MWGPIDKVATRWQDDLRDKWNNLEGKNPILFFFSLCVRLLSDVCDINENLLKLLPLFAVAA